MSEENPHPDSPETSSQVSANTAWYDKEIAMALMRLADYRRDWADCVRFLADKLNETERKEMDLWYERVCLLELNKLGFHLGTLKAIREQARADRGGGDEPADPESREATPKEQMARQAQRWSGLRWAYSYFFRSEK